MVIHELGVNELAYRIRDKELSASDVVAAISDRIEDVEPQVQAFLHIDLEYAKAQAKRIDQLPAHELERLPLAGVPIAIKDNMTTTAMPTTAGSKILEGFMAPYNATVVNRLEAAGAIIIGKTNLDEFAMGSSTEHSAYHVTRNPWDLERVPGGSSGGSAAAVAAQMVPAALGSDTGGSIRQPASYCGVTGFKPTYGRVSRYGLIAFASSLDQIGPLTRSVDDAWLLYQVIAGHDPFDATSLTQPVEPRTAEPVQWNQLRIGIPKEYDGEGLDPRVQERYHQVLSTLEAQGAKLIEISLPHTHYAIATYYLVAPAEASSNLSRFDGVRYGYRAQGNDLLEMYERTRAEGFGPEVIRRILLGTHALSAGYYDAYYLKAQKVRTLIRQDFETAFGQVDVILTPTTPDIAFKFGEKSQDPLQMYLSDVFTVTANLAGIPGISTPAGLISGIPVGIQWLGPALQENRLLQIARGFEELWPSGPWPSLGGDL
ncbi:Asp-tRNA(Asn)/Glu-tRNA(Gln) amidotransferase subunit GatA [Sulfobacillus thermosulfidooxidans]|uniref:Glutamyl-tRNA(Gln) amidotransferase subunit A n=1 Tax=Sulfobacillus thermosulfidooxidans (strain DSM 9293 / VKM B-1269 / AT-1) TaxID=929705 RepID=A0A1W1WGZ9_SULTA|nr:Asp-tRNA(Asn)/Glu-tRNA(Gln) amidotransferase subunit GatA [Sulfobacillus thermosulfidooxidans]OLZ09958.1 aspartyl/glutamyl-tRNA amidotransferase subunit A [Sulfobacillus thermosulfidooxidans]OLZ15737.1 aspartyl/glutamyl-tRNA amidotransferase subunit A [Sulfobacillus thermosulfidooxidans]OLZ18416.1 aspartyl/glutamyl-tRNA amidotransferase subunit A [Sulfobacillus thermosulfidooxidans]SMC05526.1 aspartyl/glutamyl-tRNA(Asn/Gln) amidotransferase subunit A [Sulfobacillus thermosulfidooxidans DSM 9